MKKYAAHLILALSAMTFIAPTVVMAQTRGEHNTPGTSANIGDQDNHGHYWDGYSWRTAQWWHGHQGKHLGERNQRGEYWDGGRWSAKKPSSHQDNGHQSSQSQGQTMGRSSPTTANHEQNKGNPAVDARNNEKQKLNQGENNVIPPKTPQQ